MYILIVIIVAIWLLPVTFIVLTALKDNMDFIMNPPFSLPEKIEWGNFSAAFFDSKLSAYMGNSLKICLVEVPLQILISSLTAFGLTSLNIRHSKKIFIFILIGMMVPANATLIPVCMGVGKLGLTNSLIPLIFIYLGGGFSFGVLVMRGFMRSIPKEIHEQARIDGCNNFRIYWQIVMPLARPAVASLLILNFLYAWNEFMFASVLISSQSKMTIAPGISIFNGEALTQYTKLCAGVLLVVVPVLVIFIFFQKYFVEGMSGAVKG